MASLSGRVYFSRDEPLGGGDEVVENVLFLEFRAGLVPSLAIFAAAAEVGLGEDAAHLHPRHAADRKHRRQRDIEPAVAVSSVGFEPSSLMPFLWAMNIGIRVPSLLR